MRSPMFVWAVLLCTQCLLSDIVTASRSPGEVSPRNVEIAVGADVNITCKVFGSRRSSSLYFQRSDGQRVPSNQIKVLDKSSIVFELRNATPQNDEYICMCDGKGISTVHVSVGTAPSDVTDFRCEAHDYTYMVCNFTKPSNTLLTQYSLTYTLADPDYHYACKLEHDVSHGVCNLTLQNGLYKGNSEFYNFRLKAKNAVAEHTQLIVVNNFKSTIPPRPSVRFADITVDRVALLWTMPKFVYYKGGLLYELLLQPSGMEWRPHAQYELQHAKSNYKLMVYDLPYAFYEYRVRLRMRVPGDDTKWGEPFEGGFRTQACKPSAPPATEAGIFYIDPTETRVRLYWQELPRHEHNGANFTYEVTQILPSGNERSKVVVERPPAIFKWHHNVHYEFEVRSRNARGVSGGSSRIVVPPLRRTDTAYHVPQRIEVIYNKLNGTYTLSWERPRISEDLVNYTVFWCQQKMENYNECNDTIHFVNVTREALNYTTVPQRNPLRLNLAVAANYGHTNTGMHWAMCRVDSSTDLVKMKLSVEELSATSMRLKWSPGPICTSLLKGYQLTYCRVATNKVTPPSQPDCVDGGRNITIEPTARQFLLTDLTPFSTYRLAMLMFADGGKRGQLSDPLLNRTDEEAPSPPRDLLYHSVGNTTAWLTWRPPIQTNGDIRFYKIFYNNEHAVLNCSGAAGVCPESADALISFQLVNLRSFVEHDVYVVAETVKSSLPSNYVHFRTLVGVPSNPRHMAPNAWNPSVMEWQKPETPAGRVNFYEVAMVVWRGDGVLRRRISIVPDSTNCSIRIPECTDPELKHTLQVRAVNAAERRGEMIPTEDPTEDYLFDGDDNEREALHLGGHHDQQFDDLQCIGGDRVARRNIAAYFDAAHYVLYRSVWENGTVYGCLAASKMSGGSVFYIIFVMIAMVATVFLFVGRLKWVKMSNISCKLPANIDSAAMPIKDGSFGTGPPQPPAPSLPATLVTQPSEKFHIHLKCDDDLLGASTENQFLLPNAYKNHGPDTPSSGYSTGENTPCLDSPDDAYTVMETIKPKDNNNGLPRPTPEIANISNTLGDCNGYVQPQSQFLAAIGNKNATSPAPTIGPPDNRYIKLNQLRAWPQPGYGNEGDGGGGLAVGDDYMPPLTTNAAAKNNISGYIAPQMLPKPCMLSDGYTKPEAFLAKQQSQLNSPTTPPSMASSALHDGTTATNPHHLPVISGYVTQRDLSVLAHQRLS